MAPLKQRVWREENDARAQVARERIGKQERHESFLGYTLIGCLLQKVHTTLAGHVTLIYSISTTLCVGGGITR